MIYVSNLSKKDQKKVLASHELILIDAGYSKKEIESYMKEILNEKLLNLEDAISKDLYKELVNKYVLRR